MELVRSATRPAARLGADGLDGVDGGEHHLRIVHVRGAHRRRGDRRYGVRVTQCRSTTDLHSRASCKRRRSSNAAQCNPVPQFAPHHTRLPPLIKALRRKCANSAAQRFRHAAERCVSAIIATLRRYRGAAIALRTRRPSFLNAALSKRQAYKKSGMTALRRATLSANFNIACPLS